MPSSASGLLRPLPPRAPAGNDWPIFPPFNGQFSVFDIGPVGPSCACLMADERAGTNEKICTEHSIGGFLKWLFTLAQSLCRSVWSSFVLYIVTKRRAIVFSFVYTETNYINLLEILQG